MGIVKSFVKWLLLLFILSDVHLISGDVFSDRYFNLFSRKSHTLETGVAYNHYNYNIEQSLLSGKYDLTFIAKQCPKDAFFGSYNPKHRRAVSALTEFLMDQPDMDTMLSFSEFLKDNPYVHPKVWYSSLLTAQLLRQPETLDLNRPSTMELFPSSFFPASILQQHTVGDECVFLDERFGADNGVENLLWYFREDVQLNGHHWIWHTLYPFNSTLFIPRRGELFYFVHHEFMARYTAERLSNGLLPPKTLDIQWDSVIEEGYNSHLVDGISTIPWADRHPFRKLTESLNSTLLSDLLNFIILRDRVLESVNQGTVLAKDALHYLINHEDHINTLGELSEASNLTINPYYYGGLGYHNEAHQILANIDVIFQQPGARGVMGDAATAIRDPVFYTWHKYVDGLFQKYKTFHLKPYRPYGGELPLAFDGIKISGVKVVVTHPQGKQIPENHVQTFWNMRRFNLNGGLDFNHENRTLSPTLNICAKHLDHEEFDYEIAIENAFHVSTLVTVRIFLAPRFTHDQVTQYKMSEQRGLFFSLDSFQTILQPGNLILKRKSIDSSLTVPWPRSFQEIRQTIDSGRAPQKVACNCGFPHHLLLPKGTENGMVFDLFVMITNGVEDQVHEYQRSPYEFPRTSKYPDGYVSCQPSHIHCGIRNQNYPDSKPMGYPFDRRPFTKPSLAVHSLGQQTIEHKEVDTLEDYAAEVPNMHVTQIVIQHRNELFGLHDYSEVLRQ